MRVESTQKNPGTFAGEIVFLRRALGFPLCLDRRTTAVIKPWVRALFERLPSVLDVPASHGEHVVGEEASGLIDGVRTNHGSPICLRHRRSD